jgi:TolB-like protein/class 3 adenylate cyclase
MVMARAVIEYSIQSIDFRNKMVSKARNSDSRKPVVSGTQSGPKTRRLGAIFFADVVGYTRMMEADEEATYDEIEKYISTFKKDCKRFDGKMLNVWGDGIFAVFDNVVGAVRCALKFQEAAESRNQSMPEDQAIKFRIGIHLGDVTKDSGNYFGASVNIASRLESLANPGGICVSRAIYDQVKNKFECGFEYLGPQKLKNVNDEIDAYFIHKEVHEVVMSPSLRVAPVPSSTKKGDHQERTSLVVLPFKNISGDPSEDYFSDGISEDIITSLSKFHSLFVIARGSAFTYKDKSISTQQVVRDLGVRYVTEGSIRRSGDKVRISVQLTDGKTGQTIWGEHYDRKLDDVFAVQDEITEYIVGATAVQIETAERQRVRQNLPSDMEAYSLVLQGQQHLFRYTRKDNHTARQLYEAAQGADPRYARAIAAVSRTLNIDWRYSWSESQEDMLDRALDLAQEAISLDSTDARAYSELGFVHLYRKENHLAINAYKRAMSLNPNDADVMSDMADALAHSGGSEDAIELLSRAMLLNPFYPDQYLWHLGGAYFNLKRYDESIESIMRMNNPAEGRRLLAASYAHLGQQKKAKEQADLVLSVHPNFSLENWAQVQPDNQAQDLEHFVEGLKKAGL